VDDVFSDLCSFAFSLDESRPSGLFEVKLDGAESSAASKSTVFDRYLLGWVEDFGYPCAGPSILVDPSILPNIVRNGRASFQQQQTE
jgi:hypothetical protein